MQGVGFIQPHTSRLLICTLDPGFRIPGRCESVAQEDQLHPFGDPTAGEEAVSISLCVLLSRKMLGKVPSVCQEAGCGEWRACVLESENLGLESQIHHE